MINSAQLRALIIAPTLRDLVMYSPEAEELLIFTCAVESRGGEFIKQINGPALGIYQMEPKTYNDIWVNFIYNKPNLLTLLIHNFDCGRMPSEDRLIYDFRYATAMARIHYARVHDPIPKQDDPHSIWDYYKTFYNTSAGTATELNALAAYHNFASGKTS